jgi:RimJ/RimL family protein N-acetyltransferase
MSDWEKLQELLDELVHEKPPVALELEPLIMKGREWIAQFPKGKLGYFVVAVVNQVIVGFCYGAVPTYYKPVAYIGIALGKKHRRQNIGAQLYYEIAQWAVGKEIQYLIADVWSWNAHSIKFFEHLGFVEKSRYKDKYQGELRMKVRMINRI